MPTVYDVPADDLEKAGFVAKAPKGRILTEKGKSTLDKISTKIFEEFKKENPVLEKLGLR